METQRKKLFILQGLFFALVAASVFFPLFFVISLIPVLSLTTLFYIKKIRFNAYFLGVALLAMCIGGGGDFISVLCSVMLVCGFIGVMAGFKSKDYRIAAGVTAVSVVLGALLTVIFYSSAMGKSTQEFAGGYAEDALKSERIIFAPDSQLSLLSKVYYKFFLKDGNEKLKPENENYSAVADEKFVGFVWDYSKSDAFYDLIGFAATVGILSFILVYLFNKKMPDFSSKPYKPFTVNTANVLFEDMRFDKKYFLYVFIPMLIFSFLGYIEALNQFPAALFNAVVTVPCAFMSMTLLYHTSLRAKGKVKNALLCFWWLAVFATLISNLSMFIISFLGLSDALINIRKILDLVLSKDDAINKK